MTNEKRLKEFTRGITEKEFLFAVYGTKDEEGTLFLKGNRTEVMRNLCHAMDTEPELAKLILAVADTFKKFKKHYEIYKPHHD